MRWPPTKNPERTKDEHAPEKSKPEWASKPKQARQQAENSRQSVQRSRYAGGSSASRVHAQERAGEVVREVAFMFDSIHRHIMAGYAVSIDFTRQGWRQFTRLNASLGTRYIRAFILKRDVAE